MVSPRSALPCLAVLLFTLFTSTPHAQSQTGVDNRNDLGMNLFFHRDFNNSFAFTDIVRRARNWGSVERPFDPTNVPVDSLGWPMQDAGLFLHASLDDNPPGTLTPGPAPLPVGTYRIIFNGSATGIFPSIGTISNLRYDRRSNTSRALWRLGAAEARHENVTMVFGGTRRTADAPLNTGLTNLRIYLPGFPDDGSVVFTPDFLNIIGNFGIVRFMDWIDANKNPLVNFSDRITPAHASYNLVVGSDDLPDLDFTEPLRGAALEHMVQLCNETNTDMWINIPARATDDCVRQMLQLIRNGAGGFPGLEADRRLYIEYGNEIWNSLGAAFHCFPRVSLLAQSALQANRSHPINFDGLLGDFPADILTRPGDQLTGDQPFVAAQMRHRFVAFRIKTISDIAREVFGDGQMMTRIRPVLASQFGDGQTTFSTGLRFLDEFAGVVRPSNPVPRRVNEIIFGGGGAAYSVGDTSSRDAYFRNFPQAEFAPSARLDAVLARGYGIRCIAYEGGPSLGDPQTGEGRDATTERQFLADRRMRTAFARAHNTWMQAGGDIFVYYVLTGDPTFEFAANDGDVSSMKMRGYNDVRFREAPLVTTGKLVPAAFPIGTATHSLNDGSSIINNGASVLLNNNEFVGRSQFFIPVRTRDNASANVFIDVETNGVDRGASSFEVFLNGRSLGLVNVPEGSAPRFRLPRATAGVATLGPRLNVINLRAVSGQTEVRRIRVRARG